MTVKILGIDLGPIAGANLIVFILDASVVWVLILPLFSIKLNESLIQILLPLTIIDVISHMRYVFWWLFFNY